MASEKQVAANRRNSQKSTGPTTPEGLLRSSMNAHKHGMQAKKQRIRRDDSYSFENRKMKWMSIFDPTNDVAEFLVYHNVCASFDLDQAVCANDERIEKLVETSDETEMDRALELGRRLFFDRCGPTALYGNLPDFRPKHESKLKTSTSGKADDPDNPAKLVSELEKTAQGCIWMRENWRALRIKLEPDKFWLAPDRLKAVRLLGHQPVDAATDRTIAQVFVASHALHPTGKTAFDDLMSDLKESQLNRLRRDVKAQWPELYDVDQKANCREILIDLVDQNIERLNEHLEEFEQNADDEAARSMRELRCDDSPAGHRMRNFILKCRSGLHRGFSNYRKCQEELEKKDGMMPSRSRARRTEGGGRRAEDRMPAEAAQSGHGLQTWFRT